METYSDNRNSVDVEGLPPLTRDEFLRRALALGTLALPIHFAAFAGDAAATTAVRRGGRLRVGHVGSGSSETVSPLKQLSFIDAARLGNLYDSLSVIQPDSSIKLTLAEEMLPNKDASVWQVKLRRGVTFHNGKTLTADDLLYSLRYIVAKKGVGASTLEPVDVKRSRKVNDSTAELRLKRPIGDLPAIFATTLLSVFPEGTTNFARPIGTGPFVFDSFKAGERSLFKRNPDYWVSGKPYVDELLQISIPDNSARLNALLSGQIDALEFLDFAQAKALRRNRRVQLVIAKGSASTPIYMRVNVPPFSDPRVREALKLAIDRPKTVQIAFSGFGSVGNDVFGKGAPSYNRRLPQRVYDPERAKALLKKAGKEDLRLELLTAPAGPGLVESATAYAEQAKAAGISIKLNKVPAADLYNTKRYYLKVPFGQTQWGGQVFEQIASEALLSTSPFNETAWRDPKWEKRFLRAQATVDAAARNRLYFELEREIWDRGGYIVWGFQDTLDAVAARVRGIVPNQRFNLGNYDFKSFWLA
jgi:peptide/nickel transport system substrate-binding protein